MKPIKWLFFDIGSTLVDESKCIEERCNTIIEKGGIDKQLFYNKVVEFAETDGNPVKPAARYFGADIPPWNKELECLYPDVETALHTLYSRYKLGIIANQSVGTKNRLDSWGIGRYFDVIVSSAEEGCEKPDLKIFLRALEKAKCNPDEAAMIGDRIDNDIVPAKEIGMTAIWVRQGFAKLKNLTEDFEQPDLMVEKIYDLIELLK